MGQIIEVRPGERLPLDGEVVSGSSFVDTSALTGEPVPRRVEAGDGVLAGFINGSGLLRIRVTKSYSESSVARILNLVENAAARKAPTEKFITAFAGWYTPWWSLELWLWPFCLPLSSPAPPFPSGFIGPSSCW